MTASDVRPELNRSLTGDRIEGMNDNSLFFIILFTYYLTIFGVYFAIQDIAKHVIVCPSLHEVFLCSPGCSGNHYIDQTEGELRNLSTAF